MTDEEDVDLIARYIVCRLSLLLESKGEIYGKQASGRKRKWKKQLKETKRELIARGLAKQD